MRKPLEKIVLPFRQWIIACLAVNLVLILAVFIFQNNLPPQIPLLYGLAEGEEQLVPRLLLTLPNLAALVITLINVGVALINNDLFLKKILVVAAIAATLLASITSFKIFFLVGSF
jgi:hypothetical protein